MVCCAYPNCTEEGTFPAPRDPRNIGARQYFCKPHITEFNKKWNGLDGFKPEEIFSMQHGAATWNRPTWKMGVNAEKIQGAFKTADELFQFFRQRQMNDAKSMFQAKPENAPLPPDVKEACRIFDLENVTDTKELKQKYLQLVKENHPDLNPEDVKAQESIKRINVAYKILEDFSKTRDLGRRG